MANEVDVYGFKRPSNFDRRYYDDFMQSYCKVLERRSNRWKAKVMNSGGHGVGSLSRSRTLKRFCRKGVPMGDRARIWMLISGAADAKKKSPHLYTKMLEVKRNPNTTLIEQISVDIPRTFPRNIYFAEEASDEKKQKLFNVLLAFSNSSQSIGYCQGLNYVAGMLLLVTNDEEDAFWLLKVLTEDLLPSYYAPDIPGLLTDVKVLEELISLKMPLVSEQVKSLGMPWELVLTKWLMCLFADVLPTDTALRVWDCLFYEGSKILIRVALTIVAMVQEQVAAVSNLADLVQIFKDAVGSNSVTNCHEFMSQVFVLSSPLSRGQVEPLRAKYGLQVSDDLTARQVRLANLRRKREEENRNRQQESSSSEESDCEEVLCDEDASAEVEAAASSAIGSVGAQSQKDVIKKTASLTLIDVTGENGITPVTEENQTRPDV